MAIIYTYPTKATPNTNDLILISDSQDSNKTKQVTIGSLPGGSGSGVSSVTSANVAITVADSSTTPVLTSVAYTGGANIGHVPTGSGSSASLYLDGTGNWSTPAGTAYAAGNGLDLTGTTFSTDLKADGGLVIESTELAVNLGASSITGTLAIADGGTGSTATTYCNLASNVTGTLPVANGGTGVTAAGTYDVLVGRNSAWSPSGSIDSGIQLPVGTTAQRPTASASLNGLIRYNSTTGTIQAVVGGAWVNVTTATP